MSRSPKLVQPRLFGGKLRWVGAADGEPAELRGGARLTTFLVDHEPHGVGAMGCVVERDGTRLVYGGDTRLTKRLIEAAGGVDVLIHESGGLEACSDPSLLLIRHAGMAQGSRPLRSITRPARRTLKVISSPE